MTVGTVGFVDVEASEPNSSAVVVIAVVDAPDPLGRLPLPPLPVEESALLLLWPPPPGTSPVGSSAGSSPWPKGALSLVASSKLASDTGNMK